MIDFAYSTAATINADPKVLFDIVSDPSLHAALAGSGELNKVTQQPPGPVGTGTHLLAEETVRLADGTGISSWPVLERGSQAPACSCSRLRSTAAAVSPPEVR